MAKRIKWEPFIYGGKDSFDGLFRIVKEAGGYELRQWLPVSGTRYGFCDIGYFAKLEGAKAWAQSVKDELPVGAWQGLNYT